jgi:ABC-type lipoprotein release transport system permease subunit
VAIDLADEVDAAAFLASIDEELLSWDRNGFVSPTYPEPVRPAAIADVAGMRRLPLALGAFFAMTMAGGFAISIAVATRARRRELAILGALGCSPRQRAASVRWHALTVAVIALLVGIPLGIAVGRTLYRAFAVDLGVVPHVAIPVMWTAAVAAAALAVGLLASAGPARAAARPASPILLRAE